MPLSDDVRGLADQVLDQLAEAREFYVHSRQAWRLVQQLARKGRPVGIVNLATKRHLAAEDLESRAQKTAMRTINRMEKSDELHSKVMHPEYNGGTADHPAGTLGTPLSLGAG
jgi:hypothetical protein